MHSQNIWNTSVFVCTFSTNFDTFSSAQISRRHLTSSWVWVCPVLVHILVAIGVIAIVIKTGWENLFKPMKWQIYYFLLLLFTPGMTCSRVHRKWSETTSSKRTRVRSFCLHSGPCSHHPNEPHQRCKSSRVRFNRTKLGWCEPALRDM